MNVGNGSLSLSNGGTVNVENGGGVVTLGGHVTGEGDKAQAESIARSFAGAEVVSNQIEVITPAKVDIR